jgi:hypothetical protein
MDETEGQDRADLDSAAGERNEAVGDDPLAKDRITPVVELDTLGKHLRAHPIAVAADPIDRQSLNHHRTPWAAAAGREQRRSC